MIKRNLLYFVIIILTICLLVASLIGIEYLSLYHEDVFDMFSARIDLEVVEGEKYIFEVNQIQGGSVVEFTVSLKNRNIRKFDIEYYENALLYAEIIVDGKIIGKTKFKEKVTETYTGRSMFSRDYKVYEKKFKIKVEAGSYYQINSYALFYIDGKECKRIIRPVIIDLTGQL